MKIESFGSKRDRHNAVLMLSQSDRDLTFPRERLIKQALSELSKDSSKDNVKFLLETAEKNQYGTSARSGLSAYMAEQSSLADLYKDDTKPEATQDFSWMAVPANPHKRTQNTDWDAEIQTAVQTAMKNMPKDERSRLVKRYNAVFMEQKDLTESEKKLISLREEILKSKIFKTENLKKSQKKAVSTAMRNMDFFIVSSETPIKERIYVLSKLAHFVSDDYKINPQLKDKKFQAFSEIINDIVVRTPEDKSMKIKAVDQKYHGSCAAISLARKTLAHSDKRSYIDMVMSELDDKPYMEIYDVTRLVSSQKKNKNKKVKTDERAPKIKTEKAHINYDRAAKEGYRIVDASVLNWMKIAGTVGDGRTNLEDYFAFDARHNGLMHDSRIVNSGSEDYAQIHDLLRVYIKVNELFREYDASKIRNKIKDAQYGRDGLALGRKKDIARAKVKELVASAIQSDKADYVTFVTDYLSNPKKVNTKNNDTVLGKQIETQIKSAVAELKKAEAKKGPAYGAAANNIKVLSPKQLEKASEGLVKPLRAYKSALAEYTAVSDTRGQKIAEAKRIFNIGLAQREIYKQAADIPENVGSMYNFANLPDRPTQIHNEVKRLQKLLEKQPSSQILAEIKKKNNIRSDKSLAKMLSDMDKELTDTLPEKMDKMLALFGHSYHKIANEYLTRNLFNIENGDEGYILSLAEQKKLPNNIKKVKKILKADIERLSQPMSCREAAQIMSKYEPDNFYEKAGEMISEMVDQVVEAYETKGFKTAKTAFTPEYRPSNEDELKLLLSRLSSASGMGVQRLEEIAKQINYPTPSGVILRAYEKKGLVQSQAALDDLREKFDQIREASNADNDKPVAHKSKILTFTPEQRKVLTNIERTIPKTKHDVKRSYKVINDMLKDQLEELYCDVGKRKGQFWMREETGSGLFNMEDLRLIEQMTGRPYHIELDIDDAADNIKQGKGVASSSSMVSYDEPSGHAQCVADVRPVKYTDAQTGEVVEKDVWLHDNTWGDVEGKTLNSYTDENGFTRVNYGKSYGGPKGFFADRYGLTGNFVDNFKYDTCSYTKKLFPKAISGPQTEVEHTIPFSVLYASMIEGLDPRITNKTSKVVKELVGIAMAKSKVDNLFELYKKLADDGSVNLDANIAALDHIEKGVERLQEYVENRMKTKDGHELTVEDYNNLPKNDILRVIIEKIIVTKAFNLVGSKAIKEQLEDISSIDELEEYKANYLKGMKDDVLDNLAKTPEVNLGCCEEVLNEVLLSDQFVKEYAFDKEKLKKTMMEPFKKAMKADNGSAKQFHALVKKALEDLMANDEQLKNLPDNAKSAMSKAVYNGLYTETYLKDFSDIKNDPTTKFLINFIDNVFKPRDDKDFVRVTNKLMDMTREEFKSYIEKADFKQFGIKFDTPENIIKLYHADNELTRDRFSDMVRLQYFESPQVKKLFEYPESAQEVVEKVDTGDHKGITINNNNDIPLIPQNAGADVVLPAFNILYRNAKVDLSTLSIEKVLNKHKHNFFEKYKVRPALPVIRVASEDEIGGYLEDDLNMLTSNLDELRNCRTSKKHYMLLKELPDVIQKYQETQDKEILMDYLERLNSIVNLISELKNQVKDVEYVEALVLNGAPLETIVKALEPVIMAGFGVHQGQNEQVFVEGEKNLVEMVAKSKYMVETNVLPGQHSFIRKKMNEFIKEYLINPASEETQSTKENLLANMQKNHVFTDVEKFVGYALKSSVDNKIPEDVRAQITERHKEFLTKACQKAGQASVEFKLMEMAEKGYASKMRDMLDMGMFGIAQVKNERVEDEVNTKVLKNSNMNSNEGMQFIISCLKDFDNNNSTLMLFVEQTGLVDKMLEAMYSTPVSAYKKDLDEFSKTINMLASGNVLMAQHVNSFIQSIPEDMTCSSAAQVKELAEKFVASLEGTEIAGEKYKAYRSVYVNNMELVISNLRLTGTPHIRLIFQAIAKALNNDVRSNMIKLGDEMNNLVKDGLESDISILSNVRLVEGSPEDTKRNERIEQLERLVAYAQKEGAKLANLILQSANFDALMQSGNQAASVENAEEDGEKADEQD